MQGTGEEKELEYARVVEAELTKLFGDARMPEKVKQQEAPFRAREHGSEGDDVATKGDFEHDAVAGAPLRLNSAWQNRSLQGVDHPPLVPGVKYLWVINNDGDLILGVEDPSQAATAFPDTEHPERHQSTSDGLGHPTLAAAFTGMGVAVPGAGRIGGELMFEGGAWLINDSSGRYSKNRGDTEPLLRNAAQLFQVLGMDVRFIQRKGQPPVPVG